MKVELFQPDLVVWFVLLTFMTLMFSITLTGRVDCSLSGWPGFISNVFTWRSGSTVFILITSAQPPTGLTGVPQGLFFKTGLKLPSEWPLTFSFLQGQSFLKCLFTWNQSLFICRLFWCLNRFNPKLHMSDAGPSWFLQVDLLRCISSFLQVCSGVWRLVFFTDSNYSVVTCMMTNEQTCVQITQTLLFYFILFLL